MQCRAARSGSNEMTNETKTRKETLVGSMPRDRRVLRLQIESGGEVRRSGGEFVTDKKKMSVEVIKDVEALEAHLPALEKLVEAAIEPNVFYEPWMLTPAIRAFGPGKNLQFVVISTPDPESSGKSPLLCGLFPLEVHTHYNGLAKRLPIKTLSMWRHPRCYLCTPLLSARYARDCLSLFFEWLATRTHGCSLMEFGHTNGDGKFAQLLADYFYENANLTCVTDCYTRALFRPSTDALQYVREAVSPKHRRVLRSQEARLAGSGRLEYLTLGPDDDARSWIEQFLKLEASGWKGREGSAFACSEPDRTFFFTAAMEAFRRGQLMMLALHFNGRPIAYKCNFLSGPGSFAFRIAFDEAYARFSPGVLLELENIRQLHERPELRWMDSCADPDHFMKNWLWLDRRTIPTQVVGTGRSSGDLMVAAIPMLRWLNRKLLRRPLEKKND